MNGFKPGLKAMKFLVLLRFVLSIEQPVKLRAFRKRSYQMHCISLNVLAWPYV